MPVIEVNMTVPGPNRAVLTHSKPLGSFRGGYGSFALGKLDCALKYFDLVVGLGLNDSVS